MSPIPSLLGSLVLFLAPPVEAKMSTLPAFALLSPTGQVLLSADDVLAYDWARHQLRLRPGAKQRLLREHGADLVSGSPFVVVAGGERCYRGVMTSSLSSNVQTGVVIDLAPVGEDRPDEVRLELGYPNQDHFLGVDPRGDLRIRDVLNKMGKLR